MSSKKANENHKLRVMNDLVERSKELKYARIKNEYVQSAGTCEASIARESAIYHCNSSSSNNCFLKSEESKGKRLSKKEFIDELSNKKHAY
ncbi:hypothetical protein [Photobacterium sp. GSS17]|uniref:hypothetical protein n=1 Tax=Photobacterium sp. GSS17 TaxID=3020715 RepID=UPI00235DD990|nr:hypothetical protein [Photobacterium sp. GSS17]